MTAIDNEHTIHVVQLIQEMLSGYAKRPPQKAHYSVAEWGKLWCAEKLAQLRVPDLEGFEEQALIDRIVEGALMVTNPAETRDTQTSALVEVARVCGDLRRLRVSKLPPLAASAVDPLIQDPSTTIRIVREQLAAANEKTLEAMRREKVALDQVESMRCALNAKDIVIKQLNDAIVELSE